MGRAHSLASIGRHGPRPKRLRRTCCTLTLKRAKRSCPSVLLACARSTYFSATSNCTYSLREGPNFTGASWSMCA
eukprot:6556030-Pyramimonas_sp.AAC.2